MSAVIYQFPTPSQPPRFVCVVPECECAAVASITRKRNSRGSYNLRVRPDKVNEDNRDKLYCSQHAARYLESAIQPVHHPSVGLS